MNEVPFIGLRVMNQTGQITDSALFEPRINHIDRRPFFADKQNSFASRDVIGDQVRDRLRFPGTRRPLNDVAFAFPSPSDRRRLRRVTGQNIAATLQCRCLRKPLGHSCFSRKDIIKNPMLTHTFNQSVVIANQRHLAVLEVRQRQVALIKGPSVGIVIGFRLESRVRPAMTISLLSLAHRSLRQLRGYGFCSVVIATRVNVLPKQLNSERLVVGRIIAVFQIRIRPLPSPILASTPTILLQLATRPLVDDLKLRSIHELKLNGGLSRLNLFLEHLEQGIESRGGQIDMLWQTDRIKLLKHVSDYRIDFGHLTLRNQLIGITNTLVLFQLDRNQNER